MERNEFINNIINDNYITSLITLLNNIKRVDSVYYPKYTLDEKKKKLNAPLDEKEIISGLKNLFVELNNYYIKNNDYFDIIDAIYLEYKNKKLIVRYDGEAFSCSLVNGKIDEKNPIIVNYEDIKSSYQEKEFITPTLEVIKKVIDNPDSFYEKVCFALTPEEKFDILYNLENKTCLNCTNGMCRVSYQDKNSYDEKGLPAGNDCLDWMNPLYIGKSKILQIKDIKKLK